MPRLASLPLLLILCATLAPAEEPLLWTAMTLDAPWPARHSHGCASFDSDLWVVGGAETDEDGDLYNDVWRSPDGINWTRSTADAGWSERFAHGCAAFRNELYVYGGHGADFTLADVWHSANGRDWTRATAAAPWGQRARFPSIVHLDRLWVVGGVFGSQFDRNDTWYTTDGRNWDGGTAAAPWDARHDHGAVSDNNRLYVLGGGEYIDNENEEFFDDIWFAIDSDGSNWRELNASPPWSGGPGVQWIGYDEVFYAVDGPNGRVWSSPDAQNWTLRTTNAPWAPRARFGLCVHDERLWITGGRWGGAPFDDVWSAWLDPPLLTVSGEVTGATTQGIEVVFWTRGGDRLATATVNEEGRYSYDEVPYNWSGSTTPTLRGLAFNPPQRSYTDLRADAVDQDFVAAPRTYTVSGWIAGPAPPDAVDIVFTTEGGDVLGTTASQPNGFYRFDDIPLDWTGFSTPTKTGYSFSPSSYHYMNVQQDYFDRNFTPAENLRITGWTNTPDLTIAFRNGCGTELGRTTTRADGFYEFDRVPLGWSGSSAPRRSGWLFSPPLREYVNLTGGKDDQNFMPAVTSFEILDHLLGRAPLDGTKLAAADVNGDGAVDVLDAVALFH